MSGREGSNTASRIAELRKRITKNRGIAKRASETSMELARKAQRAEREIYFDQKEIEDMGGKVRR